MNNVQLHSKIKEFGEYALKAKFEPIRFTGLHEFDNNLNDLNNFPHLFLLGCLGDVQSKAEKVWKIPILVGNKIGGYKFEFFINKSENEFIQIFKKEGLHRYPHKIAKLYYLAIQRINTLYDGNASNIWCSNSAAQTYLNFIDFEGIGQKIASMATNILYRSFKINFQDPYMIDISPDRQVVKVLKRIGLVKNFAKKEEIIFLARHWNKDYPGIYDIGLFNIGKNYCTVKSPDCKNCVLGSGCQKLIDPI